MDLEELEPRKKKIEPINFDSWSIRELEDYIASLQTEIARAQAKIEAKKAHLSGAAAFFKTK